MKKTTSTIIFLTAFLLLLGAATAESLFNDPVRFTFTENGKKYEVTLENDKIVSLYINDEAVPEEDFYLYEDMIMEKHQEVKEGLKKLDGELENLDENLAKMDEELEELSITLNGMDINVNIDSDEIRRSVEHAMESMKDFNVNISFDDSHFKMNMDQLKENLDELKNIHVSIDEDRIELALENLDEQLSKINIDLSDLKNLKVELKDEMNNLKAELNGLDIELEELSEFIDVMKKELVKDGLIQSEDDLINIKYKNGNLYINNKIVPEELQEKYKNMREEFKTK